MLTSYELFGFMSPELARRILEDTATDNKEIYDATLISVAKVRRVRLIFLKRQPRNTRHNMVLQTLTRPGFEEAAAGLIRGWLLKHQSGMLKSFLDNLKIQHVDGVVDDLPETIEDNILTSAVDGLLETNEKEIVILYLHAFVSMNGMGWTNLENMLTSDERLQF